MTRRIESIAIMLSLAIALPGCGGAATDRPPASRDITVDVQPRLAQVVPSGTVPFTSVVSGTSDRTVVWEVVEAGGGTIDATGHYAAPATTGQFHVRVSSHADPSAQAVATVTVTTSCWDLLPVNRVRIVPAPGMAAAMVGGKIQGSNDSPTNGFVDLVTIQATPAANPSYTELTFSNTTRYRFLKYWGAPGSYGQVAEIEFYSGTTRLTGAGFGTAGSRSARPWQNALDGDPATYFDGPLANDVYVGVDAASEHLVGMPSFSPPGGSFPSAPTVTISSSTEGSSIRYTTDGSDPTVGGLDYSGAVVLSASTTLRAVASRSCMFPSSASAVYQVGTAGTANPSSIHIGNSLTDTIDSGWMSTVARSGGFSLDYWRYTIPGIGTYIYPDNPTGGNGLESAQTQNVQTLLRGRSFDHVSFQPAANMPCVPTGHASENPGSNRSDAANINQAWNDAVTRNPNVQFWVFATWSASADYADCMTGAWNRDPAIWNPPTATSWGQGIDFKLQYNEAVRAGLVALHPSRPPPYIVPAGLALKNLKARIEAGEVPGIAADSFFLRFFQSGPGTDDHLSADGRYYVTLVFYACMFNRSPEGLPHAGTNLTDAQAAVLQQTVWQTVSGYALSGVGRR